MDIRGFIMYKKRGVALLITLISCFVLAVLATSVFTTVYRYKQTQEKVINTNIREMVNPDDVHYEEPDQQP